MVAWLGGEGREPTGTVHPPDAVRLLAPVPEPPSVRDFYAFEGHVAAGWRRRGADIPEHWYAEPVFYFSNPASIHGPGEPVQRPAGTRMLDFELEIAAVVGAGCELAGFTLMNDWSARDLQRREMTVLLGPSKAKDFATSLGPWLVTPDELPLRDGRLQLEARPARRRRDRPRERRAPALRLARDPRPRRPRYAPAPRRRARLGTLDRGCLLDSGRSRAARAGSSPGTS